ncbi:MAG: 16S rRNA processing protein RimM [Dehalococcoidia bacterium]|nr:16S rRNA processing protein RimM [Dehalococcoidia bacterium]
MDVSPSRERMIPVGRILSPRGFGGEVRIEVLSDSPGRFAPGGAVFLRGRRLVIGRCSSLSRGRMTLALKGLYDRAQAEDLRGALLTVPEEMVPPLPEGHYYHFQLVDMEVFTADGEHLGRITEVLSTGANDVYLVAREAGELLVPALEDVVVEVDVGARRMVVDLPPGLRD